MADMLSILIIMIVIYICVKKLVIPRIVALRAAKKGQTSLTAPCTATAGGGMPLVQTAIQTAVQTGGRPVTCFDMRLVDATICNYDENGTKDDLDAFTQRVKYAASELLLSASTRGDNVRLYALNWKCYILLYVTYTVR